MVEKLLQDPFLWNQNWVFLWTNGLRFSTVYLYCMPSWGRYLAILKPSSRPLAFTTYEAFLKNKKRSGTSMTASFSAWLLKKNISLIVFYYLTKFHYLAAFTSWDIGQYVYGDCLLTCSILPDLLTCDQLFFHCKTNTLLITRPSLL